eukprot:gene15300-16877_t
MSGLSSQELEIAKRYIDSSGSAKNPISLIMELGQLLHYAPVFEPYEDQDSSVHQHIFNCRAIFHGYEVEAKGFNKKKVKTKAAELLVDRILKDIDANSTAMTPPSGRCRISSRFQYPRTTGSLVRQPLGKTSVTNTIPRQGRMEVPSHGSSPLSGVSEKVDNVNSPLRAFDQQLRKMNNSPTSTTPIVNGGVVEEREEKEKEVEHFFVPPESISPGVSEITTALEKLTILSQKEDFKVTYYDLGKHDDIHLCLVKANLQSNFVCHGTGENIPQARENAAENLLRVVNFFKNPQHSNSQTSL